MRPVHCPVCPGDTRSSFVCVFAVHPDTPPSKVPLRPDGGGGTVVDVVVVEVVLVDVVVVVEDEPNW
jgi:hypothetical protein